MTLFETLKIHTLFDSHAHLAYFSDSDMTNSIENAKKVGLSEVLNMGIDLDSSIKVIQQAKSSNSYLKAFIGIDPEVFEPGSTLFVGLENKEEWVEDQIQKLKELIDLNKELVYGIGETGMDYYHFEQSELDSQTKERSKHLQRVLFNKHLGLAQEYNMPLSIHSRWAEKECLEIVKNYNCKGIFHSYTGDYNTAKAILDSGWSLGVNGIVTFKNANQLREVYKQILGKVSFDYNPIDFYKKGIYFETDSPFLSPEGKRGLQNQPSNVIDIYNFFIKYLQT